jgi:CoA-binding domain
MSKTRALPDREALISPRSLRRAQVLPERRRSPRPRLAEIRRGANLNLLPPNVVAGAVRMVEFVLVAALGFGIYLAYVEREGENAHLVYLGAVLIAATANMLMFQALDLYRVPAFSAFVRSFTRITVAWTLVMGGMMALAFFGKVGAEFSRVWIATWVSLGALRLVQRETRSLAAGQALDQRGPPQPPRRDRGRRSRGGGADQGRRSLQGNRRSCCPSCESSRRKVERIEKCSLQKGYNSYYFT